LIALVATVIISGTNYWFSNLKNGLRWGVRSGLIPLIGGMVTYTYLAVNLPGSASMLEHMGTWAVVLLAIIGAAIGVAAAWIWQVTDSRRIKTPQS